MSDILILVISANYLFKKKKEIWCEDIFVNVSSKNFFSKKVIHNLFNNIYIIVIYILLYFFYNFSLLLKVTNSKVTKESIDIILYWY